DGPGESHDRVLGRGARGNDRALKVADGVRFERANELRPGLALALTWDPGRHDRDLRRPNLFRTCDLDWNEDFPQRGSVIRDVAVPFDGEESSTLRRVAHVEHSGIRGHTVLREVEMKVHVRFERDHGDRPSGPRR